MYTVKIFRAIESESLEKQINKFLQNHTEITEPKINISETDNHYVACLTYETKN